MKKEQQPLITIECFEEGVGTPVNPYANYLPRAKKEFSNENPPLPAYYSDTVTPLPKGFKGDLEVGFKHISCIFNKASNFKQEPTEKDINWAKIYLSPTTPDNPTIRENQIVETAPVNSSKSNSLEAAPPVREEDRNWTEDFMYENGNYTNLCRVCNSYFAGHKRRVVCKLCSTTPAKPFKAIDEGVKLAEKEYPLHNDPTSDPEVYLLRQAYIKGYSQQNARGKVSLEDINSLLKATQQLVAMIKDLEVEEIGTYSAEVAISKFITT